VAGGQLQSAFGHQIDKGVDRHRRGFVDRAHNRFILMCAADRENLGIFRTDHLGLIAQASGDDHPTIFGQRFADRLQALFLSGVQKTAGVDQNDIRALIVG
jgi:hypothetical protein